MNDINAVLKERGARYGNFMRHADITLGLRNVINAYGVERMASDQQEALFMICHKMGRILNGDPDYADSWTDIAGYAKLVADRLNAAESADVGKGGHSCLGSAVIGGAINLR